MRSDVFILFGGLAITRFPNYIYELNDNKIEVYNFESSTNRDKYNELMNKNLDISKFDEVFFIEIGDFNSLLQHIEIISSNKNIIGVYSLLEDFVVEAARIATLFDVKTTGILSSVISRNKHLQRIIFKDVSPEYYKINKRTKDINYPFPAVVKPINMQGSFGVMKVLNTEELKVYLDSVEDEILCEQYIEGDEYSVETVMLNKKVIYQQVTSKTTNCKNTKYFAEIGHTVPANVSLRKKNAMFKFVNGILNTLKFDTGISHIEIKCDNERIYLVEVAVRNPGDSILTLHYLSTGVYLERLIIKCLLDKNFEIPRFKKYARQVYLEHNVGKLLEVILYDYDVPVEYYRENGYLKSNFSFSKINTARLLEVVVNKKRGSFIKKISNSDDRVVYFIVDANSYDDLDNITKSVEEKLLIMVGN